MRLYRVARRSGHLGTIRTNWISPIQLLPLPYGCRGEGRGGGLPQVSRRLRHPLTLTLSPALRGRGKLREQSHPCDQSLPFADMCTDSAIERAVFACVLAVAQRIAIAERRTALVRLLRYRSGRIFLVFRNQFSQIRSKALIRLYNRLRRERALAAIGPDTPPSLFRNRSLSRTGHPPDMGWQAVRTIGEHKLFSSRPRPAKARMRFASGNEKVSGIPHAVGFNGDHIPSCV